MTAGLSIAATEESTVDLTDVVPFLVEDELTKLGGVFSAGADWAAYAVQDGNLITGQNPASSAEAARMALKAVAQTT